MIIDCDYVFLVLVVHRFFWSHSKISPTIVIIGIVVITLIAVGFRSRLNWFLRGFFSALCDLIWETEVRAPRGYVLSAYSARVRFSGWLFVLLEDLDFSDWVLDFWSRVSLFRLLLPVCGMSISLRNFNCLRKLNCWIILNESVHSHVSAD